MTDQQILSGFVADYRPYDTLEAFGEGFVAYQFGNYRNPYDGKNELQTEVNAQAWDRGATRPCGSRALPLAANGR